MTPNPRSMTAVLVGLMLTLAACQNTESTTDSTTTDDTASDSTAAGGTASDDTASSASAGLVDGTIDAGQLDALVDGVDRAYGRVGDAWSGFDPNDHPTVLAWRNDADELIGAVAFNHPDPNALGAATALDTEGRAFDSAHVIEEPVEDAAALLAAMESFEFKRTIGGVDSFMMIVGGSDSFFDPTSTEYQSTLLHEMFHRYQELAFADGAGFQDVEGYAYTADNIELATLEERALVAALDADDDDERRTAAAHAAAIRLVRRAADDRVVLDDDQERMEGTARYIEHTFAGDDDSYSYHANNFTRDLVTDPSAAFAVKDHYGFGRFYASGAAVYGLLAMLGVDDIVAQTEGGTPPMTVLANSLGVSDTNAEALVAEAREAHDPDGELAGLASDAAATALEEGPVFDDEPSDDESSGGEAVEGDDAGGEGDVISDEELACLAENGVDIESEQEVEIPADVVDACFDQAG